METPTIFEESEKNELIDLVRRYKSAGDFLLGIVAFRSTDDTGERARIMREAIDPLSQELYDATGTYSTTDQLIQLVMSKIVHFKTELVREEVQRLIEGARQGCHR